METELIESKIKHILADVFSVEEKEVVPSAELIKDLGADSLDQMEAIMEIEKEFDITIADKDTDGFKTVQDVLTYIKERA